MILAIVGPTGVGKTKLSVMLAHIYDAIIINADSTQVYKGMDIGTAKVTEEEKEGVPHFLLDIVPVTDNYTAYNYQKDARELINKYKDRNIIFVGGTGLYLKSALYNYVFLDEEEHEDYAQYTNEELYELCLKKDPNMKIHKNNRVRLERFLNKKITTNEPCYPLYDVVYIGLTMDRKTLYERINKRVDEMFNNGLIEEVRGFYEQKLNSKVLNTAIGYKELFKYFDGLISLDEARELIKKKSRNYAKRQYTWFNNQMDVKWFSTDLDNFSKTVGEVKQYIDEIRNN